MNKELTERYNRLVRPEDLVYHLGDIALDDRLARKNIPLLNGHKVLLPGNHDQCHPRRHRFKRIAEHYKRWGFEDVFLEPFIVFKGKPRVLLSHCPSADYEDPRYPEYRPDPKSYDILFHGHVHERWRIKRNACGSVMVNVGVDQWDYEPVQLETLMTLAMAAL